MKQVTTIFSVFMVIFYLAVGIYFIFYSNMSYLDKPVRVIMGSALIFYGLFRAYGTYVKIIEVFFTREKGDE
jgi:hypothetical protein